MKADSDNGISSHPLLLVLRGIDDHGRAFVSLRDDGSPSFILTGGSNLQAYLDPHRWQVQSLLLGPSAEGIRYRFNQPSLILNEITDPDSHGQALAAAKAIRQQLPQVPCINEPEQVLKADRQWVSEVLQPVSGLLVPKTLRFSFRRPDEVAAAMEAHFDGAVIIRKAGDHNGVSTQLLKGADDLSGLNALPFDGSAYYLTAFHPYQSEDGRYRKYRLAIIGGEVYPRHIVMNDEWMVHASNRDFMDQHPDCYEEEKAFFAEFENTFKARWAEPCRRMAEALQLDYFGVDCSVLAGGELLVFEANANMNMMDNSEPPNHWEQPVANILQAVERLCRRRSLSGIA